MGTFIFAIIVLAFIALGFAFFTVNGYSGSKNITLELDQMYTNMSEMACAVYEELTKQGRQCEIIETGKGFPKLMVDGVKYVLTYRMAAVYGVPVQRVHLKQCRE